MNTAQASFNFQQYCPHKAYGHHVKWYIGPSIADKSEGYYITPLPLPRILYSFLSAVSPEYYITFFPLLREKSTFHSSRTAARKLHYNLPELRRENYIHYHCRHLKGIDFNNLTKKIARTGNYECWLPTIINTIEAQDSFLVHDWTEAQKISSQPVKITITGPMTITVKIAKCLL